MTEGTAAGIYGLRLLRPQLRGALECSPRWVVARDEMLAETPRDIHLPQGIVDYQYVSVTIVAGETNLMPPGTPEKVNTLIFDALAI